MEEGKSLWTELAENRRKWKKPFTDMVFMEDVFRALQSLFWTWKGEYGTEQGGSKKSTPFLLSETQRLEAMIDQYNYAFGAWQARTKEGNSELQDWTARRYNLLYSILFGSSASLSKTEKKRLIQRLNRHWELDKDLQTWRVKEQQVLSTGAQEEQEEEPLLLSSHIGIETPLFWDISGKPMRTCGVFYPGQYTRIVITRPKNPSNAIFVAIKPLDVNCLASSTKSENVCPGISEYTRLLCSDAYNVLQDIQQVPAEGKIRESVIRMSPTTKKIEVHLGFLTIVTEILAHAEFLATLENEIVQCLMNDRLVRIHSRLKKTRELTQSEFEERECLLPTVYLCGFSYGGAVAQVLGFFLHEFLLQSKITNAARVHVVSVGSPRAGNRVFAEQFQRSSQLSCMNLFLIDRAKEYIDPMSLRPVALSPGDGGRNQFVQVPSVFLLDVSAFDKPLYQLPVVSDSHYLNMGTNFSPCTNAVIYYLIGLNGYEEFKKMLLNNRDRIQTWFDDRARDDKEQEAPWALHVLDKYFEAITGKPMPTPPE